MSRTRFCLLLLLLLLVGLFTCQSISADLDENEVLADILHEVGLEQEELLREEALIREERLHAPLVEEEEIQGGRGSPGSSSAAKDAEESKLKFDGKPRSTLRQSGAASVRKEATQPARRERTPRHQNPPPGSKGSAFRSKDNFRDSPARDSPSATAATLDRLERELEARRQREEGLAKSRRAKEESMLARLRTPRKFAAPVEAVLRKLEAGRTDPYWLLGVRRYASLSAAKRAFRQLVVAVHPGQLCFDAPI